MGAEQDPDRDGWPEYHRPPRDVVPRPPKPADDIPEGTTSVTYYEVTADGIERFTERIYVTTPYTGRSSDHE